MIRAGLILVISILLISCDCVQRATGVVLDKETKLPVQNVAIGKYVKEDSANYYARREYTDKDGHFDYRSVSGGIMHCPDLRLYFSQQQYNTLKITFSSYSVNDTIFLERKEFNPDSSPDISQKEFDGLVNSSITLLQTQQLKDISDAEHIRIMMCLNTITMQGLKGYKYDKLKEVSVQKKYTQNILKIYTHWVPNRGMGFNFYDLKMELYGTPSPYAVYNIIK
jgi:5-hydroxyisourate hydrolase-like protein (transthyretin family)